MMILLDLTMEPVSKLEAISSHVSILVQYIHKNELSFSLL